MSILLNVLRVSAKLSAVQPGNHPFETSATRVLLAEGLKPTAGANMPQNSRIIAGSHSMGCQQNCQQKVPKGYARVVKDLARLLRRNTVKSLQIKSLEGQILPLEPICQAANYSESLINTGGSSIMRVLAFNRIRPQKTV
jgi:hypothetical protein